MSERARSAENFVDGCEVACELIADGVLQNICFFQVGQCSFGRRHIFMDFENVIPVFTAPVSGHGDGSVFASFFPIPSFPRY